MSLIITKIKLHCSNSSLRFLVHSEHSIIFEQNLWTFWTLLTKKILLSKVVLSKSNIKRKLAKWLNQPA